MHERGGRVLNLRSAMSVIRLEQTGKNHRLYVLALESGTFRRRPRLPWATWPVLQQHLKIVKNIADDPGSIPRRSITRLLRTILCEWLTDLCPPAIHNPASSFYGSAPSIHVT
jgi:hypothetical protein